MLTISPAENAPQTSVNASERALLCAHPACEASFRPKRNDQRFCSPACKSAFHKLEYAAGRAVMAKTMKPASGIRAANLATSKRLQRIYEILKDGNWHSSLELSTEGHTVAASTGISELRAPINGLNIERRQRGNTHEYRLIP